MSKRRVWSGVEVEVEEVEVGGSRREDERSGLRLIAIAPEAGVLYVWLTAKSSKSSSRWFSFVYCDNDDTRIQQ